MSAPIQTAEELVELCSPTFGLSAQEQLAARVEAVLALIDSRWQVPPEVIISQIKRLLDGEQP